MFKVTYISETGCFMLLDGLNNMIDYEFINGFLVKKDMYYRKEVEKVIKSLLERNKIKTYQYDSSVISLLDKIQPLKVKVYFENGDHITTDINLTPTEAYQYYVNNYFNIGTLKKDVQKCIRLEILN